MKGRWVVERIFSWLGNYRRLARNYEQYIRTAGDMAVIACSIFMLRYFRLNEGSVSKFWYTPFSQLNML